MTAIAIKLDGAARSFARGATVFLPLRNRTATRSILAGLALFLVSHYLFLHFFPMYVAANIFKVNSAASPRAFSSLRLSLRLSATLR
jgi:hypothetical protein